MGYNGNTNRVASRTPIKAKDHHAIITIYNLPQMSDKEKIVLVEWLLKTADEIKISDSIDYSTRYRAKLMK